MVELVIVMIIIGLLATFAVPQFGKVIEKTKVAKAKNSLALVCKAQKMWYAEKETYQSCTVSDCQTKFATVIDIQQIGADPDWDYNCAGSYTGYTCNAIRTGGAPDVNAKFIIMDSTGAVTGNHPFK